MIPAVVATGHLTAALGLPGGLDTGPAVTAANQFPGGWHLHCFGPRNRDCTAVTVTYTALERARQQGQMLTLHANAAVTPSGCGALLLGNMGAGKTSVTLALGARGWTHVGDDHIRAACTPPLLNCRSRRQITQRDSTTKVEPEPRGTAFLQQFGRHIGSRRRAVVHDDGQHRPPPGKRPPSASPSNPGGLRTKALATGQAIGGAASTPSRGPRWRTASRSRRHRHPGAADASRSRR